MFPLRLLLLISGTLAMNCSNSDDTFYLDTTTGEISMKNILNKTITIIDKAEENLKCFWVIESYIECTPMNVTSINLTDCQTVPISVVENSTNKLIFNMSSSTCEVTKCTGPPVTALMREIQDHPSEGPKDLRRVLNIRDMCADLFKNNRTMRMMFIGVERYLVHNMVNVSITGESVYYHLRDLALIVFNLTNLTSADDKMVKIKAPELLSENNSYIPETWIPIDALQNIPEEKRRVGVVTYKSPNQFLFKEELVRTMVIRIEVGGGRQLENLITPLKMKFKLLDPIIPRFFSLQVNYSLSCQYFNEYGNISLPDTVFWKTDGCVTKINDSVVECICNHATPFAVLLIADLSIDSAHWQVLSYISYIGCGLSAFFTAVSFLTYVITTNSRVDNANSIHVSLSGALFLLNTSFLLNEWGASLGIRGVCIFIAAAIHYSLLSCFTWMAIEAVHLYLLLVKVFNTYYRHYMAKLSAIGWGLPGIIVGVSLAVKDIKPLYGPTEMTMADTNQTNTICWIMDIPFFYSMNLAYFTIIFVLNSGILLTVTTRICQLQRYGTKGKPGKASLAWKDIGTVLGLTCLLGITWGLAFLSYGYVNLPILYLFSIFNSLQGFFIFLWICGTARKDRERVANTKSTSAALNTSTAKPKEEMFPGNNSYQ
ncbi:adhesion G-protein coupled receptor G6 isoform X2 [Salmo trutta]|uniref:adhesion G-protein coupled receptor G6 isoform X2 n=1 Tax=Salmo trutta TaxID=8032 RepID=UPI001131DFA2|nr:adhesion G-protein coupled receptor G6-like isoform X2 [Salmo trutta]